MDIIELMNRENIVFPTGGKEHLLKWNHIKFFNIQIIHKNLSATHIPVYSENTELP